MKNQKIRFTLIKRIKFLFSSNLNDLGSMHCYVKVKPKNSNIGKIHFSLIQRIKFLFDVNINYLKNSNYTLRVRRKPISKEIREKVFELHGNHCYYCSIDFTVSYPTIDHYIPFSVSQDNSIQNLVPSCDSCNTLKKDINPETDKKEWNAFLKNVRGNYTQYNNQIKKLEYQFNEENMPLNSFLNNVSKIAINTTMPLSFTKITNTKLKQFSEIWDQLNKDGMIDKEALVKFAY